MKLESVLCIIESATAENILLNKKKRQIKELDIKMSWCNGCVATKHLSPKQPCA